MNLSNVFLVQFPNFSLSFLLLFQWLIIIIIIIIISRWLCSCIEIRGENVFRRLLESFSRVPQGSFLGSLPCNIYWRYMELTNQFRSLMFADIKFFCHVGPSDCCARLQAGVGSTQGWYVANRTNRRSRKTTFKRQSPFVHDHKHLFCQLPGSSN